MNISALWLPSKFRSEETRLYFDPAILDFQLWQAEPELLQLHEQLAIEKLQELARYDLVGEVRRAIGSTLESGETTLETVAAQLNITPPFTDTVKRSEYQFPANTF